MAETTPSQPGARLFYALEPAPGVREALVHWQREALTDAALRPVPAAALHLTLCFLGSRPESEAEALAAQLDRELAVPVELRLEAAPVPVPARRPRLFALGADSEGATRLHAMLVERLLAAGLHQDACERPFWPHLTVARVRSEPGRHGRPLRVTTPPHELPEELLAPFDAVRVALYRSHLRSGGSDYVSLASLELPHPAQAGAEKR